MVPVKLFLNNYVQLYKKFLSCMPMDCSMRCVTKERNFCDHC